MREKYDLVEGQGEVRFECTNERCSVVGSTSVYSRVLAAYVVPERCGASGCGCMVVKRGVITTEIRFVLHGKMSAFAAVKADTATEEQQRLVDQSHVTTVKNAFAAVNAGTATEEQQCVDRHHRHHFEKAGPISVQKTADRMREKYDLVEGQGEVRFECTNERCSVVGSTSVYSRVLAAYVVPERCGASGCRCMVGKRGVITTEIRFVLHGKMSAELKKLQKKG